MIPYRSKIYSRESAAPQVGKFSDRKRTSFSSADRLVAMANQPTSRRSNEIAEDPRLVVQSQHPSLDHLLLELDGRIGLLARHLTAPARQDMDVACTKPTTTNAKEDKVRLAWATRKSWRMAAVAVATFSGAQLATAGHATSNVPLIG